MYGEKHKRRVIRVEQILALPKGTYGKNARKMTPFDIVPKARTSQSAVNKAAVTNRSRRIKVTLPELPPFKEDDNG